MRTIEGDDFCHDSVSGLPDHTEERGPDPAQDYNSRKPGRVNGVQHDTNCNILHTPAFHARRRACNCGALTDSIRDRSDELDQQALDRRNSGRPFYHD